MTASRRLTLLCAAGIFFAAPDAAAQDRSLHWRRLDAEARLDDDGRLHVRERQAMVFTGDWNGGSRTFNLRPGQEIELRGITRIERDGTRRALRQGSLSRVDNFDWADRSTVRWRSRLPEDPPFANQEIVYELDYTLSNILLGRRPDYTLDHDFAFPDRDGVIEQFTLDLAVAQSWRTDRETPLRLSGSMLEPGRSFVVNIPLQYLGDGIPAGVLQGPPLVTRLVVAALFVALLAFMMRAFFAHERRRGRFEPLYPAEQINADWLHEHIFSRPAEVVGALWDDATAAPEVTAMLARMVQEGKLTSRIEGKGRKAALHLNLKVPRHQLPAAELRLVDALFDRDKDATSTDRIRKRYASTGFDPAAIIREDLAAQVQRVAPVAGSGGAAISAPALALAFVSFATVGMALFAGMVVVAAMSVVIFTSVVALAHAYGCRRTVVDVRSRAWRMCVALMVAAAAVLSLVLGVFESGAELSLWPMIELPVHLAILVGSSTGFIVLAFFILRFARTNEPQERLELRRTLAAGREYFMRELDRPEPMLQDAWYPYLLAFGLGAHMDKWFGAFGGKSSSRDHAFAGYSSGSGSGSWTGGGPLFGGSGGFAGGGASRTWAAAAGAMSAGVAAPSSSSSGGSSGGGGGGGGSSGGGGGGGW